MFQSVVCITCGSPTGQIYDEFNRLYQEIKNNEDAIIELFKRFNVRLMCCKRSLTTPFMFTASMSSTLS